MLPQPWRLGMLCHLFDRWSNDLNNDLEVDIVSTEECVLLVKGCQAGRQSRSWIALSHTGTAR